MQCGTERATKLVSKDASMLIQALQQQHSHNGETSAAVARVQVNVITAAPCYSFPGRAYTHVQGRVHGDRSRDGEAVVVNYVHASPCGLG